jgi:hypothetical protein
LDRIAAHEILLKHDDLPNPIRSGQIANIRATLESGGAHGMTIMDQSLPACLATGSFSSEETYAKAAKKFQFQHPASAKNWGRGTPTPLFFGPSSGRARPAARTTTHPATGFNFQMSAA